MYAKESEDVPRLAFGIAKRVRLDYYRRRKVDYYRRPKTVLAEEEAGAEEASYPALDGRRTAEERLLLMQALQSLSPEERRIIEATLREDRTRAALAAELGMTGAALSNRLYTIRRKLRKLFDAEAAGARTSAAKRNDVQFTAYWPAVIVPIQWYTVPVYAHLPGVLKRVRGEAEKRLGDQAGRYARSDARSGQTIARGAEILVVPELAGCQFNPPSASFLWLEDCHCAEFRLQASPRLPGFEPGSAVQGCISFYVGPVLVAETRISAHLGDRGSWAAKQPERHTTCEPYKAIFVSYSHRDTAVAEQLEEAYQVLGMQYLRDVHTLRSGEPWNPALLKKIEQADIFQLLWSSAAKSSVNVRREWKHALCQGRPYFIRPVYWEVPMPQPPRDLRDIHFAYLKLRKLLAETER